MSALIIGHSFVRRMQSYLKTNHLDLRRQFPYVFVEGFGGATVNSLWQELTCITTIEPKVFVIDIGSNDLCSYHMSPLDLALNIVELAGYILMNTLQIKAVVVMQIMCRGSNSPRYGQRNQKS